MEEKMRRLAEQVRTRNDADEKIADLIGRPATVGGIGEFVASKVFSITLVTSGAQAGYDGHFDAGPCQGSSVNIKTYSRHASVLDIGQHPCDYYLVLTGPSGSAKKLPWVIDQVFLFHADSLLEDLRRRGVKIGVATSVAKSQWEAARIYPQHDGSPLRLTSEQQELLALFASA